MRRTGGACDCGVPANVLIKPVLAVTEVLTAGRDFAKAVDLLVAKYPQYVGMGLSRDAGMMIKVRPGKVLQWRYAS